MDWVIGVLQATNRKPVVQVVVISPHQLLIAPKIRLHARKSTAERLHQYRIPLLNAIVSRAISTRLSRESAQFVLPHHAIHTPFSFAGTWLVPRQFSLFASSLIPREISMSSNLRRGACSR